MDQPPMVFTAIGTHWRIDADVAIPPATSASVAATVEAFDRAWSRFRPDSLVSSLRRRPGTVRFPAGAAALLALYRRLYEASGGAVTPLVGGALEHLGYDPAYTLRRRPGPATVPAWDDVLRVDGDRVTTTEPVTLDVGAAGKGFLVDRLAELLGSAGIGQFLIDASGDLLHRGDRPERIGLEDPYDPGRVIGVLNLAGAALCASATTRRSWGEGLHHIVDPARGEPVSGRSGGGTLATWVTSASCAEADGLATALFFVEPSRLAAAFDFAYVRLRVDGSVDWSDDLDGEVFTGPCAGADHG